MIAAGGLARNGKVPTKDVCRLLGFRIRHFSSPSFGTRGVDPTRYLREWQKALPYKKEHLSILVRGVETVGCWWRSLGWRERFFCSSSRDHDPGDRMKYWGKVGAFWGTYTFEL
jgi:hypothetical protein